MRLKNINKRIKSSIKRGKNLALKNVFFISVSSLNSAVERFVKREMSLHVIRYDISGISIWMR